MPIVQAFAYFGTRSISEVVPDIYLFILIKKAMMTEFVRVSHRRPLALPTSKAIYTAKMARSWHSPADLRPLRSVDNLRIFKMWFSYVVVAVSVVAFADAYSSGAPEGACKDMIPRHPVPPQKSAAPYTITTSTKAVKAGTPMEVVITGKGPSNTMRGLLLQARAGDQIVGKFTLPPNDKFAQLMNCGEPGNAVSHKKHDEKDDQQTVKYTWTPPAGFNDEIKFRATIASNGAVFWVGVESAPVKVTA